MVSKEVSFLKTNTDGPRNFGFLAKQYKSSEYNALDNFLASGK